VTDSATLVSAAHLIAALIGILIARGRSNGVRIVLEVALLLILGSHLLQHGADPLSVGTISSAAAEGAWLRAIAVVWWLIGARLFSTVVVLALGRDSKSRHASLVSDLLAGAIYLAALTFILNSVFGIPIKGLLATSGVIAIVLGLALQNTLSDVFSGIATGIERPFGIGQHVSIGDHAEGIVTEMNWRAIRLQTDGGDLATIPNSIVARSSIINHSVPSERRSGSVEIPTPSSSRSEKLMELARQATLLCPDILPDPAPSISLKSIGTRITTIGVGFHVATTPKLSAARGQLLRQVRRLFAHAEMAESGVDDVQKLLAGIALFETLAPDQIDRLAKETTLHSFEIGETLMEQDSVGSSLFVIRSGIFEIHRRLPDGSSIIYGRVGPGEYLGEVSMMSGDPRAVTIVSISTGSALELPRSALEALLKQDVSLRSALDKSMQRGLSRLERDDAARVSHPLDAGGSMLHRIRAFLAA
jgi:small-conductance mechanosensitive channel